MAQLDSSISIRRYFEENASPLGARLVLLFMIALGVIGLLLAEQVLTGWLAMGERANISRRDINFVEWVAVAFGVIYAIAAFRTAYGWLQRERASWAWSQWVSFFTIILGFGLIMSVAIPAAFEAMTNAPSLRSAEPIRLIPGFALFLCGLVAYRYVAQGTESSTENRVATGVTPTKGIQIELAKSPSAGAIIGFIFIFFGFIMATDLFLEQSSIASVLTNISSKGMMAIGITILMISGEFDLSVGSILGVTAMAFMSFMTEGIPGTDSGPIHELVAVGLALLVAIILGLINGLILVTTRIPSFIVTLGTLLAYRAITLVVIGGGRILRYRDYFDEFPQVVFSPWFFIVGSLIGLAILAFAAYRILPTLWRRTHALIDNHRENGNFGTTRAIVGSLRFALIVGGFLVVGAWLILVILFHLEQNEMVTVGFFDIVNGRWEFTLNKVTQGAFEINIDRTANFRNAIIWWLFFVAFFQVILTSTRYGNAVFAVGGNEGAARAQGINVNRIKVQNFVLSALLTGVAAIYETTRNPGVDPLKGDGWELEVIAMTVIGGALLTGGYGSIFGSLLGALIFGMLQTGLVLVGVDSRLFQGTVGVIIIIAVVLNTQVRNTRN